MPRLNAIPPAETTGKTSELRAGVKSKIGLVPNLMRTFVNSTIVAHIALNIFTNYFNHVAQTVVDFPKVKPLPHSQPVAHSTL